MNRTTMLSLGSLARQRERMRTYGRRLYFKSLFAPRRGGLRLIRVGTLPPLHIRSDESDLEVVRDVFIDRTYEIGPDAVRDRVNDRYASILAAGKTPVVIDAGANIGASTLWFAEQFPEARVVAVEPDRGNVEMLRKNLAGHSRCVIVDAAIGAEPGFASLSNPEQLSWSVQTERAATGVPVISIADAVERSGRDELFIVKVDIEGFESDLFSSNLEWLDRAEVVFVEPHDWLFPGERRSGALQRAMANRPFELFTPGNGLMYVRLPEGRKG